MARAVTTQHKTIATVAAWIVALLIFFPILYTIITSFKSEQEAIQGFNLIPSGTFESYTEVQAQSGYFKFFFNSVLLSVGSTILALLVAIPAAWSMAFSPTKRTKDILMWMLSTKMMPAVAVLFPIYLIFRNLGLLDSRIGLMVMLMLINLPIVVWMLYTYFREIPGEILEAARMDGASLWNEIIYVLTHDGPADGDALALAAGELARPAFEVVGEVEDACRVLHLPVDGGLVLARHLQREGDVLGHGHMRVERVGLEHHGQLALGRRLAGDVTAVDVDGAAAGVLQPGYQPQQRGLAATRRADEDDELAILDHQVEAGDD